MDDDKKHYKYGGSTIELTGLCPGSAKARVEHGPTAGGPAAERGIRIHSRVEQLFKNPKDKKGALKEDEELIAQGVLTTLIEVAAELGFSKEDLLVEEQVTLHEFHIDAGGALDYGAFKVFGDLLIIDLKAGARFVSAFENIQEIFYGCCLLQRLDPFIRASLVNAHFIILQPEQQPPYEVQVRRWTIPVGELSAWQAQIKLIIDRAENNPDLRIAGDHCEGKYCPVRATCETRLQYLNEKSLGVFDELLAGNTPNVSCGGRLAEFLKVIPEFEAWCKSVKEHAKQQLMTMPDAIPGWGLEDAYGNRTWVNDKELEKKAKELGLKPDEYRPRSLIGPAPFERLLKAKKLECDLTPLVKRPYTGVKLTQTENPVNGLAELFADQLVT